MTTDNAQRSVLLISKSRLVLDESVAGLRDLGYKAEATNDFTDITGGFDLKGIDLVVFGGQVPLDRKAELRGEIGAINPRVIFVQGLAGIPGLIVNQVRGAFTANDQDRSRAPTYTPDERSIRLTLAGRADVRVTVWWQTSFVATVAALAGVDEHEAGLASGLSNTALQIGGALGVAITTTVAVSRSGDYLTANSGANPLVVLNEGFQSAFLALVVLAGIGIALALLLPGRPRKAPQERPEDAPLPVQND
jgi:hypothetical protein